MYSDDSTFMERHTLTIVVVLITLMACIAGYHVVEDLKAGLPPMLFPR